jgi:hypothetical protein
MRPALSRCAQAEVARFVALRPMLIGFGRRKQVERLAKLARKRI